jgi:hypothetical protein
VKSLGLSIGAHSGGTLGTVGARVPIATNAANVAASEALAIIQANGLGTGVALVAGSAAT